MAFMANDFSMLEGVLEALLGRTVSIICDKN